MRTEVPNSTIRDAFSEIKDPRMDRNKRHMLSDILIIAICAVVCGADTWVEIEAFGKAKLGWFQKFLELPNGIPSHDTFGDVFARLHPGQFRECFLRWVQAVFRATAGQVIAIDGKTLRRSHDRANGKAAIHMVSAWATANQIVLGQVKTNEKSNEITAIPELLRLLEIKGCIITIDAMGCQKDIAAQIIDQEGDYVLALKGNQSTLHDDVQSFFEDPELANDKEVTIDHAETTDGDHGRVEIRRYSCTADIFWLDEKMAWKGLNSICKVESERHVGDTVTQEVRYFIGSIEPDANLWAHTVRTHWGIENQLHWRLDIAFREDESRIRKDHGPENFATLRHIALNLVNSEKSTKASVRTKRLRAGWDEKYLLKLLAG